MPWTQSWLAVCGLDELPQWTQSPPTRILSFLDPHYPVPEALKDLPPHDWTMMRFDDIIAPAEGKVMPTPDDMRTILEQGRGMDVTATRLLVHCHMGVSRSTAAALALLAQSLPEEDEDTLLLRLHAIRPQAWPNSLMVGWADEMLGRQGRLLAALGRHYARQIAADPRYPRWMRMLKREAELELAGYCLTA